MYIVNYLATSIFVLVSAHAAQVNVESAWPAWLKARDGRKHNGDTIKNGMLSGGNSTNVAQSGSNSTNAPLQASTTKVPTGDSDGLALGISTPAVRAENPEDPWQENRRLKAEVEALRQSHAAAVQANATAEESIAQIGDNSSNVAQSRDNITNATPGTTLTSGGNGGWLSWLKKWGGHKQTSYNSTNAARSAGNSTKATQSGDNSTNVAQSGGNSTNVAESSGNGTTVAQSGVNSTNGVQSGDDTSNSTLAMDEPSPISFAKVTNMTNQENFSFSPMPSRTTKGNAAAVGDPHLQNIHGERFDLTMPGKHVLIHIPRKQRDEDVLLRVEARVRRLGDQCADMYFQELNITGAWVPYGRTGGLHFQAQGALDEHPKWLTLGKVNVKIVHGRTLKGYQYLNFYVKHLGRAGFPIGGLLGEDDHTEAAMPSESCVHRLSLLQIAAPTDQGDPHFSLAEASLA